MLEKLTEPPECDNIPSITTLGSMHNTQEEIDNLVDSIYCAFEKSELITKEVAENKEAIYKRYLVSHKKCSIL